MRRMVRKLGLKKITNSSDWTALSNDTTGIDVVAFGVLDRKTLRFNKADGVANTVFAGVSTTAVHAFAHEMMPEEFIMWQAYCPDVTNVAYAFLRLGSSAAHYCEYRYADTSLVDGSWSLCRKLIGEPSAVVGNGIAGKEISYLAAGFAFDAETNTLAGLGLGEVFTALADFAG